MDAASLNTSDLTDQTVPAALEEKNEVVQTRRASLPRACKKTPSSQPQSRGKSKPSSRQRKTVAAEGKISVEANADVTSVDKPKERPSLPRAAKTQSQVQEKKPEKKAEDYQSSVARHLVQNDVCARAYNDLSFRVVRVCLSKSHLDVMEALYIRSLKPDLCAHVQRTSITTLQLFRPS